MDLKEAIYLHDSTTSSSPRHFIIMTDQPQPNPRKGKRRAPRLTMKPKKRGMKPKKRRPPIITAFPLFAKLPTELQIIIWKFANTDSLSKLQRYEKSLKYSISLPCYKFFLPHTFSVSYLSRQIAFDMVKASFLELWPKYCWPLCGEKRMLACMASVCYVCGVIVQPMPDCGIVGNCRHREEFQAVEQIGVRSVEAKSCEWCVAAVAIGRMLVNG